MPYENDNGEMHDPIITKRDEIREVAKFIMNEQALEKLEESRNVSEAKEESQYCSKEGLKNNLKQITRILNKLNIGTLTGLEDKDKETIKEVIDKIDSIDHLYEGIYGEINMDEIRILAEEISVFFQNIKRLYNHDLIEFDIDTFIYKIDRHYKQDLVNISGV